MHWKSVICATGLFWLCCQPVPAVAHPANTECTYSATAAKPPDIPKTLLVEQQIRRTKPNQVFFSALLKTGEVVTSTHSACENFGANVLLILPSPGSAPKDDFREDIQKLLTWYIGAAETQRAMAKLGHGRIEPGWSEDLAGGSDLYQTIAVRTEQAPEGYAEIGLVFYSM